VKEQQTKHLETIRSLVSGSLRRVATVQHDRAATFDVNLIVILMRFSMERAGDSNSRERVRKGKWQLGTDGA